MDERKKKNPSVYVCVYIYIHIHTAEYYSAIKKKEILLFVKTWLNHEGITLSEMLDRKR